MNKKTPKNRLPRATKTFGNAIKKATFQKNPFCRTKHKKKPTDDEKFSFCKKKTGLNWNQTIGLCRLKHGVTPTWNEGPSRIQTASLCLLKLLFYLYARCAEWLIGF